MDAIAKAKASAEINIDDAIALNKKKLPFLAVNHFSICHSRTILL